MDGVWHEKVQALLQFLHVPAPEFVRANGERLGKYHLEAPVAVADCRWFLGGFPFCKTLPADFEGDADLAQKQYRKGRVKAINRLRAVVRSVTSSPVKGVYLRRSILLGDAKCRKVISNHSTVHLQRCKLMLGKISVPTFLRYCQGYSKLGIEMARLDGVMGKDQNPLRKCGCIGCDGNFDVAHILEAKCITFDSLPATIAEIGLLGWCRLVPSFGTGIRLFRDIPGCRSFMDATSEECYKAWGDTGVKVLTKALFSSLPDTHVEVVSGSFGLKRFVVCSPSVDGIVPLILRQHIWQAITVASWGFVFWNTPAGESRSTTHREMGWELFPRQLQESAQIFPWLRNHGGGDFDGPSTFPGAFIQGREQWATFPLCLTLLGEVPLGYPKWLAEVFGVTEKSAIGTCVALGKEWIRYTQGRYKLCNLAHRRVRRKMGVARSLMPVPTEDILVEPEVLPGCPGCQGTGFHLCMKCQALKIDELKEAWALGLADPPKVAYLLARVIDKHDLWSFRTEPRHFYTTEPSWRMCTRAQKHILLNKGFYRLSLIQDCGITSPLAQWEPRIQAVKKRERARYWKDLRTGKGTLQGRREHITFAPFSLSRLFLPGEVKEGEIPYWDESGMVAMPPVFVAGVDFCFQVVGGWDYKWDDYPIKRNTLGERLEFWAKRTHGMVSKQVRVSLNRASRATFSTILQPLVTLQDVLATPRHACDCRQQENPPKYGCIKCRPKRILFPVAHDFRYNSVVVWRRAIIADVIARGGKWVCVIEWGNLTMPKGAKVKLRAGTEEILLETLGRFGFYFPQGVPSPDPEEVDNG